MSWFTSLTSGNEDSMQGNPKPSPSLTTFVHAGSRYGPEGEVMTNICLSTTFKQSSPGVPIGVNNSSLNCRNSITLGQGIQPDGLLNRPLPNAKEENMDLLSLREWQP
jgi:hypothetical protein